MYSQLTTDLLVTLMLGSMMTLLLVGAFLIYAAVKYGKTQGPTASATEEAKKILETKMNEMMQESMKTHQAIRDRVTADGSGGGSIDPSPGHLAAAQLLLAYDRGGPRNFLSALTRFMAREFGSITDASEVMVRAAKSFDYVSAEGCGDPDCPGCGGGNDTSEQQEDTDGDSSRPTPKAEA